MVSTYLFILFSHDMLDCISHVLYFVFLKLYLTNFYFTVFSSVDGAYEIADADRKTFFTKAGRPVKDGGGVWVCMCVCVCVCVFIFNFVTLLFFFCFVLFDT